jgi:hypothetical protein
MHISSVLALLNAAVTAQQLGSTVANVRLINLWLTSHMMHDLKLLCSSNNGRIASEISSHMQMTLPA